MSERILWLVVALMAVATPCLAQTTTTRREEAQRARESKALTDVTWRPGRVERFLGWIENSALLQTLGAPRDGFGVRISGIDEGAGVALGPSWRTSNLLDGAVQLSTSAAVSITGDREISAGAALRPLTGDRVTIALNYDTTHLARARYFGRGMSSAFGGVGAYALDRRDLRADLTVSATRWLRVSGSAGTLRAVATDGRATTAPPIGARFTADSAPGLGGGERFVVASMRATADFRDVQQNPRHGGHYQLALHQYRAADRQHSFARVDVEVEQHLSVWKRQRLMTVRGFASTALTSDGNEVPFYLQPTLGGSRLLRGFSTDRFRDRSLLAVQAEYAWDISPFINAVLFYEAGAVAPRMRDISTSDFRRDYGLGFRFGSARVVAFRTDVAFGSGEGTRVTMRFNHAF